MRVKNSLAGLLVGIVTGAVGVLLIQRIHEALREEDVDVLRERLADQLANLEEGLLA